MAKNKTKDIRKSANLLPTFFRTEKNTKFLSSTIDQLFKVPSLERIDGFVGSKLTNNYNPKTDVYIPESLAVREKYQLEPALILKHIDQSIKAAYGIDDLINQVGYYGGNTDNLDRLFRPTFNSYDPHIDWDKLINFREYYWLPNGPDAVLIAGLQKNIVSTYTVTDTDDGNFFIFTPDGLTPDPLLTFYRGITYVFNIKSKHKLFFKTTNTDGYEGQYTHNLTRTTIDKTTEQIVITIDGTTPSVLFYDAADNQLASGRILVKTILENSKIDVDKEIVGKKTFKSANGIEFINGLKVRFVGNVTPSTYIGHDYIVEGVGEKIRLIDFSELTTPLNVNPTLDVNFDSTPFDEYPFDDFRNVPETPEYITINRASQDLNPWSRYNRWVHSDVITASATANGIAPEYPAEKRASRPIVEFRADLQLWNFGRISAGTVDYIDTVTTDAFSTVEGSYGFYIDGIQLEDGNKVIFNADPDPMVQGKVFEVTVSTYKGKQKLNLTEVYSPSVNDAAVIRLGNTYQGSAWWFNGTNWVYGQQRSVLNQAPLFDLFDKTGHSYSDKSYYDSQFFGNKVFGYAIGTGTADSVLGFPLQYISESISTVGSYLFTNYLNSEEIILVDAVDPVPTVDAYLRINHGPDTPEYVNAWTAGEEYHIPVLQFQVIETSTSEIEITVFDNISAITDLTVSVFVNDVKQLADVNYTLTAKNKKLYVTFTHSVSESDRVLFKCYTSASPNSAGAYETPLNLTNNPLNGLITSFTLSELSDHVKTMADRSPDFVGSFPGVSNLKSLPNISKYGTRLISNHNPLSFAQCFITNPEHNAINAIRKSANDYYQFRLNLLKFITQVGGQMSPAEVLDQALLAMSQNKNASFPYAHSDMLGYGDNNITSTYTVTDPRNKNYSITSVFSATILSDRSVLVYLTPVSGISQQLVYGTDYDFLEYDASVRILRDITKGDVITIKDYFTTVGSYIPQTPTKLGLYPKYQPDIIVDTSYANVPQKVIQGHDGSLTIAFSAVGEPEDYRDLALLEFERRIYNNIKVTYNPELLNIHDALPSIYRTQEYTYDEIYKTVQSDFIKWAATYGLDFATNSIYNIDNHKTYNFRSVIANGNYLPGNWRAIYKLYFDTDRPNTHPWEMLGFSIKPTWWEEEYGSAPYTAGNLNMWQDLEAGLIRRGERAGVDPSYVRPGLSQVIPVDDSGNIIDVREWAEIAQVESIINTNQDWVFGDHGPVETTWRRSPLWPFAMQIIMALTKPADYAALMFDVSRLKKDITGQYNYGVQELFLNPKDVLIYSDIDANGNFVLASGYSVWVVENGRQRSADYASILKNDLASVDFNLFYKAGGFLSKDKLEITIDSLSPTTPNPGVLLPNEDYTLHFNISVPIKSVAISGIIVEKKNGQFAVKGYDKNYPYFTVNKPVHQSTAGAVTVGGRSESFLAWTANAFYQTGQVVYYSNAFYRVLVNHNAGTAFTSKYYQSMPRLPIVGGVSVLAAIQYEPGETIIPYGTRYSTIQEVYDLILGYGHWLGTQGFAFDEYNSDLNQILDWNFTGKEFLYWTTQNWADTSVITLSPFANTIKYQFKESVVDNVLDSFYEYSLLKADGQPFPSKNFVLNREDGVCTITTKNTASGLFFARLNLIQKEHAIIMSNKSMFNDTIYDIETGYRQRRIKLTGFRTSDWNGEFLSPGFIYDDAQILDWAQYTDYKAADIVKYTGNYYSALNNITGTAEFNFAEWSSLGSKPVAQLLPNFDYKINQFEDFYSLDIDNFDSAQQKMAQHLTGYTPREYLDNIFVNPIAQYKFYQGYIREKGTRNVVDKLAKASIHNLQGQIEFNEEWAFRVGYYGNYTSYNELEFPLREADFRENSQIVKFVDTAPVLPNDVISYIVPTDITIQGDAYSSDNAFMTISSSTYEDNNLLLPIAGYVRTDDVTATAYNKNSLLDIANNGSIKDSNTIWLGFREDGEWDVYRYTIQRPKVLDAQIIIPASTIKFITDIFHNLSVGDVISVYGLDNGADGVYIVNDIPTLTSFVVSSTLAVLTPSNTAALLYKFVSIRVDQFDSIAGLQNKVNFQPGDLVWVDDNGVGKWTVYQKAVNYSTSTEVAALNKTNNYQDFGYRLATQSGSDILAISAPRYLSLDDGYGRIYVYNSAGKYLDINYGFPEHPSSTFGSSLVYADSNIFAGSPGNNYIKITGIDASNNEIMPPRTNEYWTNSGLVGDQFGASIFVATTATSTTTDYKILLVGAPGRNSATGAVYAYNIAITDTAISRSIPNIISTSTVDGEFGQSISGNSLGNRVAISAPNTNAGVVYVYSAITGTIAYNLIQTISSTLCKSGDQFGSTVIMSKDGTYLFASSTSVNDGTANSGKVFVYKWNGTQYESNQTIDNPSTDANLNFGHAVTIDNLAETLVITGRGDNKFTDITFDNNTTTFDGTSCNFGDTANDSGAVYIFNRYNDKFIYAEELFDNNTLNVDPVTGIPVSGSRYGESVAINNGTIIVGAPGKINDGYKVGSAYLFTKKDITVNSWNEYRTQNDLIDLSKVKRAVTIDNLNQSTLDYLDIIDPAKGRIAGIADQEVRYKTAFDPAVYSIGVQGVVVDTDSSWIEEHLGELWWDLSSVKYQWYEQGDLEYRKNSWGKLFPGASIDVYEWVSSEYLPSQWSALADTVDGLTKGISGQPKYPDNSVISVKQYYNATTGSTTNVYFFWVKNKVTVPDVNGRKISANEVARLIYDPSAYGIKCLSVLAPNAIAVTNVTDTLFQNNVYLNIAKDDIDNDINQHTEWLLLADGDANSMPNELLDKKLIDSLLGRDTLGNLVPDPFISDRIRYGVGIRPRQSLFKDRIAALRNAVEYTNSVLSQYRTSDFIKFDNLNSKDPIPDAESREYDEQVDNEEGLYAISTNNLKLASLYCEISSAGKISAVYILDSGFGYKIAPTVTVVGDNSGAIISTEIDENGSVVSASIINPGQDFIDTPLLEVRPYTVIVTVDATSNNLWTKYQWYNKQWNKSHTQDYDTTKFWDYVDWKASEYDILKPLTATVEQLYLLDTLTVSTGDYIKVKNQGNGRYIILAKVDANGTFNDEYDLIYSEKGTIKFKDELWNKVDSIYNFDYKNTYDQTLYDQSSEAELEKVLLAIKEDIFVGPLKVYWNKFFFKAVRYAMSEQKFLDWAFKTSFINVRNMAGPLDQRAVYKFQNSQYYEDYLSEVKPYHTKIRNFQVNYDVVDPTQSYTTDFDLPSTYDNLTGMFIPIELDSNLLDVYPRKGWADNYTYTVDSITVADGGSGYTTVPKVTIIPAPNDIVTTATAVAYISLGKVIEIEVTNPGSGYTRTPTIVLTGGGSSDVVNARAYANLVNGKVRSNIISVKLDRISGQREIGNKRISDRFLCDGNTYKFDLSWAAENKKSNIDIRLDGIRVLAVNYNIETYTKIFNGYHKLFSRLVLTYTPFLGQVLSIEYNKSINLYNAAERIQDYYNSDDGMPGNSAGQLMYGVDYPGTRFQTLPFSYNANWDTLPFAESLWDDDTNGEGALDTILDGGDLAYTLATGLNPEDLIVDGDEFISPNISHGPEELVPGEIQESLAISVYTRVPSGSPMISQSMLVVNSVLGSTTAPLSMLPPNTGSVMVSYNNRVLDYGTDYTLDINAKTITILPQSTIGIAGITVVGVGGTALAASDAVTVSNTTSITLSSGIPNITNIGSVYASLNGTTLTPSQYTLNKKGFTVANLNPNETYTLQAWFFESAYKGYSEVKEQLFITYSSTSSYVLSQYPGVLGPVNAAAIVELDKRRLIPPHSTYYSVQAGQLSFEIDPNNPLAVEGAYDLNSLQVFVNGIQLRNSYDFILDQPNKRIIFVAGSIKVGDVIAITNFTFSDYYFDNGRIYLKVAVPNGGVLKVITYTNHDSDLIRTEVFSNNSSRRYTMNRAIYNDDYVWVTVDGNPLVNGLDYYIDTDHKTVVIDENYPLTLTDTVTVMSMTDQSNNTVIGYRMFHDILNRSTFKRLSERNSTRLAQPLYTTSTTIVVQDSSVLSAPNPSKNIPGVLLIVGERIEYMQIDNTTNTLSRIKRATLGTGAADMYPAETQVMDQSAGQTLPYAETLNVNTTATFADLRSSYVINDMSIKTGNSVTATMYSTSTNYKDLVRVYYGGVPLRKDGSYIHYTKDFYDTVTASISTITVSTSTLLPVTNVLGIAHVVTSTNQVWVYTDSNEVDAVNGYVYRGLNYLPPEYDIVKDSDNVYVLNLKVTQLTTGTNITLVQHTARDWYASTTTSLLNDSGAVAVFLNERQAALPDKYHYGQL